MERLHILKCRARFATSAVLEEIESLGLDPDAADWHEREVFIRLDQIAAVHGDADEQTVILLRNGEEFTVDHPTARIVGLWKSLLDGTVFAP